MTDTALADENLIKEMIAAGTIYGHKKTKTHPKMKPYISANRNEIELIEPEATLKGIEKAGEFLKERKNALVLLAATQAAAASSIKTLAEEFNFPFVHSRWLGGTLTNFKVIQKRINHYQELKGAIERGELQKYTKKERMKINKEFEGLKKNFESLIRMTRLPDVLFVVDPQRHSTAVREARRLSMPTIAIIDSDDDPSKVDISIPANDHARSSIEWVVNRLKGYFIRFEEAAPK